MIWPRCGVRCDVVGEPGVGRPEPVDRLADVVPLDGHGLGEGAGADEAEDGEERQKQGSGGHGYGVRWADDGGAGRRGLGPTRVVGRGGYGYTGGGGRRPPGSYTGRAQTAGPG